MENTFWDSNFFQTIVLIITVAATVCIALWQYNVHKRKELNNAVSILLLQIRDIERNIEYLYSEGLINGVIQESPIHYSSIIFEENHWNKYAHTIVGYISSESFEMIDNFFRVAQRIREQQIYIKQKIQLSLENKAFYYYNDVYNNAVIAAESKEKVQSIVEKFNSATVPAFIQTELALGLEKTMKQYHKLTDGRAYEELKKLK